MSVNEAVARCVGRIVADIERGKPYDIGEYMRKYKVLRELTPAEHHEVWFMISALIPTRK